MLLGLVRRLAVTQPTATEAGIAPLSAALHWPISASRSLVERTQTSLAGARW